MAKKKEEKTLAWQDVAPDALKGNKAYDIYKTAQKDAAEKRDAFETAFIEAAKKKGKVPDGKTLRFSYRFGKLAVALDDADAPKSAKPGAFTL